MLSHSTVEPLFVSARTHTERGREARVARTFDVKSTWALRSSSSLTTFKWPLVHAFIRGVLEFCGAGGGGELG